jgi:hypothetical protein
LLKLIKNNSKKIIEIICKVIRYFSSLILVDSIEQTKKAEHIDDFWKETEEYLRESQDFWLLKEIDVDGKKNTQLEDALEKGRSFKKEELLAPNKWLTPENYQTYVRRVVEILQKFKDVNNTLDGYTDKAFEELKAEYELIKNHLTSRKGRRKPHTVFALHKKELKVKRGDAWSELKEYAKNSKGEIQIDLPGYGQIYLKLDKDVKIGNLRYKETVFSNSTDGFMITRKAFDSAWDD